MTRTLTAEQAELLRAMTPRATLIRAAFAGQPFRMELKGVQPRKWPEALVLSLIELGALFATQKTEPWPMRNVPARPFSVILTKDGEELRQRLLAGRVDLAEAA